MLLAAYDLSLATRLAGIKTIRFSAAHNSKIIRSRQPHRPRPGSGKADPQEEAPA